MHDDSPIAIFISYAAMLFTPLTQLSNFPNSCAKSGYHFQPVPTTPIPCSCTQEQKGLPAHEEVL
jgi:hypothetical protein